MKSFLSPIEEIVTDLSQGKMVVIVDDEKRENEGDLIFCASSVSAEKINFMAKFARGLICLALDKKRFKKMKLKLMTDSNKSRHRTAFTVSIEAKKGVTTGISAQDRSQTIKVAVSSKSKPSDLVSPGHIFPLLANDGGVLVRAGHTEAAVDLARMATNQKSPYGVICEIMNDDGTMARLKDLIKFCEKHKLKMPYIVVVVDEMSDLMLVSGKEIENYVQKLSAMARAAGIHIIMATQRPSVDVITGTIKANFPTRISFQVSSKIDSKTVLGEQGAEQLLGKGDMLFMSSANKIFRIHGPYVSESEIEKVNSFLRSQGNPDYIEEITISRNGEKTESLSDEEKDELYEMALKIVKTEKKASTSFLQRKLQIGYNRAARIIDQMEDNGIVSKANHVGKREVL